MRLHQERNNMELNNILVLKGGKILANDNLPQEVSMQQISLQGALKTLIMYLRS